MDYFHLIRFLEHFEYPTYLRHLATIGKILLHWRELHPVENHQVRRPQPVYDTDVIQILPRRVMGGDAHIEA